MIKLENFQEANPEFIFTNESKTELLTTTEGYEDTWYEILVNTGERTMKLPDLDPLTLQYYKIRTRFYHQGEITLNERYFDNLQQANEYVLEFVNTH